MTLGTALVELVVAKWVSRQPQSFANQPTLFLMIELAEWFEDYDEQHPLKGLRMRSPREYIRELSVDDTPPPTARCKWAENELG